MEILVEAPAKRDPKGQVIGRTDTNKAVVMPRLDTRRPGSIVTARITRSYTGHSLYRLSRSREAGCQTNSMATDESTDRTRRIHAIGLRSVA